MYGYIAAGVAIFMLALGLGYKDYQAMEYAKDNAVLQAEKEYSRGVAEEKTKQELIIADLIEGHGELQNEWTVKNNDLQAANIKLSINAGRAAASNPLAFITDLGADIINYDCLRGLGSGILTYDNHQECRAEADRADPARSGFSGTAITPAFRDEWNQACESREQVGVFQNDDGSIYSLKDWGIEFPIFDANMCFETIAAITPDTAREIARAFGAFIADLTAMHVYAKSQGDIIKQLSADRKVPAN